MTSYRGTVSGNVVVLPEGVELPDGQAVDVRVVTDMDESIGTEHTETSGPEEGFLHRLLEVGLIAEVKRPGLVDPARDRQPITVKGKPLSELIVEERR